jgi:osmotically-inducible protein OsmY
MYRLALIATVASMLLISAPLFASETDNRIVSSAQETYVFKTYLKDDNLKVESKDGLVTLTGTVSNAYHKSLAEETVAGLPGVTGVDNKIVTKEGASDATSDLWLITKVKTTLLFHKNVSGTGTEVLADKGTITLRGEAANVAQKDLTTEYAMDIEGVEKVNNEMTLSKAEAKTDDKTTKVDDVVDAIDDASITAMVKTTLFAHRSTSALKTKVQTKDGVVTLEGKAKNDAEKALAGKITSDVHGVKNVNNNMTVE